MKTNDKKIKDDSPKKFSKKGEVKLSSGRRQEALSAISVQTCSKTCIRLVHRTRALIFVL